MSAEHPPSYYAASAKGLVAYPALKGAQSCDVAIIGGGYTGLSAALHLAERGHEVILLEARRVGWGASGRNGGQLHSGQRRDQAELEAMVGRDDAQKLWRIAEEAKALVIDLIRRHDIACDLKFGLLHADHKRRHVAHSRACVEKLCRDYGYDQAEFVGRDAVRAMVASENYHGGWLDRGGAHLHPLNLALGLARAAAAAGARIHEGSAATRIVGGDPVRIETEGGTVSARFLLLACNGHFDGVAPKVERRVMPINNFLIATEPLGEDRARALIRDDVAVSDSRFVVNYFRLSADRRLIFGGGESYSPRFPKDIAGRVRRRMLRIFPQLSGVRIDHAWGGTLAITPRRLPLFARLTPNVLVAAGYSGHGVGLATLGGQILTEAVAGTLSRFDVMARLPVPAFPGGRLLRWPTLVAAMGWYALRDRL